jgi:putative membrane protein
MKASTQIQFISSVRTSVIKRSGAILLSAFCLVGLASCDKDDNDPIVDTISQQDRNFAISSSQFINAQIAFSELVAKNGQDDSVLEYGRMILTQNNATKTELAGILDSKKVEMSDGISTEMQASYGELALLQGEAFDEAYIDYQISELDKAKSMFENQVDNGQNFTIKGFATKTLDAIQTNRNKAVVVRTEIDIENI